MLGRLSQPTLLGFEASYFHHFITVVQIKIVHLSYLEDGIIEGKFSIYSNPDALVEAMYWMQKLPVLIPEESLPGHMHR